MIKLFPDKKHSCTFSYSTRYEHVKITLKSNYLYFVENLSHPITEIVLLKNECDQI